MLQVASLTLLAPKLIHLSDRSFGAHDCWRRCRAGRHAATALLAAALPPHCSAHATGPRAGCAAAKVSRSMRGRHCCTCPRPLCSQRWCLLLCSEAVGRSWIVMSQAASWRGGRRLLGSEQALPQALLCRFEVHGLLLHSR